MPRDRIQSLRALVAYQLPIELVLADLSAFPWDSDEPLVVVTRQDVIAILDRYLESQLTAEQVTDWADLIECRDDLSYPELEHERLVEAVFRLANPYLRGDITPDAAVALRHELTQAHGAV